MRSFGATDIGKKRKMNQDYFFCSDDPVGCFPNLYIVADGMGGHKAGDMASSYAVTRFVEFARHTKGRHFFQTMKDLLEKVNTEIYQMSVEQEEYAGMGTTFVAATVLGDQAYIVNIGDSRLYYYDGKIRQVTLDHSLVEELVRAGELNPAATRSHPQKNIITRAVGVSESVEGDFFQETMKDGSCLLLCSDGLSNMVTDGKLSEILSENREEETAVRDCIDEALFYGGADNIAVVVACHRDGR